MFGVVILLFGYDVSVIFLIFVWCEFDDKNFDFDRVILFVDLEWLKSIDFTGGLWDWWDANWLVLMCYFFIKYVIFGVVRWNALFIRVWWDFWC